MRKTLCPIAPYHYQLTKTADKLTLHKVSETSFELLVKESFLI